MHLLSVYCVALDGISLTTTQCSHLLLLQGSQLVLLVLCMRNVLHLAGGRVRALTTYNKVSTVVFVLHLLATIAVVACSIGLAGLAMGHHSTASLLIDASVTLVTSCFYAIETWFEFLQHTKGCKIVTFVVLLVAIEALAWSSSMVQSKEWVALLMRWKTTSLVMVAILAVLRTLTHPERDTSLKNDELFKQRTKKTADESPLDHVGWISRLSFQWISPFVALGKKRRLELKDVPNLPMRDATSIVAAKFNKALLYELGTDQPSFLRLARRLYGADVLRFALWATVNKGIGMASPLLLKLFLDWADSSTPSLYMGYYLAVAMGLRSILSTVSGTQYDLAWKRFDLRVRAGLELAIYTQMLKLSSQERREAGGLGRITNLLSVDVGRIVGMPGQLFELILIPLEIVVALVLLSQAVSIAFIAGIAALVVMLPLQTIVGRKIQSATRDMMQFRDTRVGLAAESLKAMRTLKLLGWVKFRLESMTQNRSREMGRLQVRKYLDACCVFLWASTPVIVQVAVFATAIVLGQAITAANAFTTIALLDRLIFPMNFFPWIISGFLEARVSALRIRDFLFDNSDLQRINFKTKKVKMSEKEQKNNKVVSIRDSDFCWGLMKNAGIEDDDMDAETPLLINPSLSSPSGLSSHRFVLRIKDLQLRPGSTYVVCGPVGAGKSSLLLALLGEVPSTCSLFASRSLCCSYAPQIPWLFRGSIKANVTMSKDDDEGVGAAEMDGERYERVLRMCEFDTDLHSEKQLKNVAESGGNFSGGQRARINLARALYQRARLYLLDDPFSGLDAATASNVVTNCFSSTSSIFPKEAAVMVVTHSLHLLPLFPTDTQIIVMEDGCIVEQGSYDVLKTTRSRSPFMTLLTNSVNKDHKSDTAELIQETREANEFVGAKADSKKRADLLSGSNDDEEEREAGAVSWYVWKSYALKLGRTLAIVILWTVIAMQITRNSLDWWIAVYTDGKHTISPRKFAFVLLYIAGGNIVAVFSRSFLFAYGGLRAARIAYKKLVQSVFAAPLSFFERTPTGRILNRLSGDTYAVDESLPFVLNLCLRDVAELLGSLVILFYGNRLVLVLLVPLSVLYFYLQRAYRPCSRHLKRLDAVTLSPLLAMVSDTLDGLIVIRAAQKQEQYAHKYDEHLNRNQRVSFLASSTSAWFGMRLDLLGICVTSFVAVFAVVDFQVTGKVNPGSLGLTLTYALPIVGKINALLNSFIDLERQMIAVERINEYADLEPEENCAQPKGITKASKVPNTWPASGHIAIEALTITYRPSVQDSAQNKSMYFRTAAPALNDVTCDIPAGQKLGICGRTGAGKSTLLNALFRTVPWEQGGSIMIDTVPLDSLSLSDLRSRLTYIPQDVVLFSGTIRSNLDPSGAMDDERLWTVLRKCGGLSNTIAKLDRGLESVLQGGVEDQVATFSQGQAQLLCIARAMLRPSKVLCIDEATASLDFETERAISEAIATEFATSTVLTVAHRIQTIMHCDCVLLFDNGRIAERGDPKILAQNSQSLFYQLAKSCEVCKGL